MTFDPTETLTRSVHRGRPAVERYVVAVHPHQLPARVLDGRLVVGRQPPPGALLLEDNRASRQHAEFNRVRGRHDLVRLRDLGSKNGTWLNGRRIDQEYLSGPGVVRVGDSLLVYTEVEQGLGATASPVLSQVEARADRAGRSQLPVLIHGPSGAGKERIAQRIHAASGRSGRLVAVNCATFSAELLASELFGHIRGAFSGAQAARDGLFVSANRGTVFLDEIAELPLSQQPALLRVLQEGRVRPVGSDREISVDVRVIAATHRDLEAQVAADAFRGDLFARLAGVRIELPGLMARREEILPLFHQFTGGSLTLGADAAEALLLYDWPYNVRELQHLAKALCFERPGGQIEPVDLPEAIQAAWRAATSPLPEKDETLDDAGLRALMRLHAGNVSAAAREVGLTRQQLYRRLQAAGIDPAAHRDA